MCPIYILKGKHTWVPDTYSLKCYYT